jgi:hypothetical protein
MPGAAEKVQSNARTEPEWWGVMDGSCDVDAAAPRITLRCE